MIEKLNSKLKNETEKDKRYFGALNVKGNREHFTMVKRFPKGLIHFEKTTSVCGMYRKSTSTFDL